MYFEVEFMFQLLENLNFHTPRVKFDLTKPLISFIWKLMYRVYYKFPLPFYCLEMKVNSLVLKLIK